MVIVMSENWKDMKKKPKPQQFAFHTLETENIRNMRYCDSTAFSLKAFSLFSKQSVDEV